MEMAIILVVSALLLAYTLLPMFRPAALLVQDMDLHQGRIDALQLEKTHNLKAIKDIDFDLATGKISADDHDELRTLYSLKVAEAIEAEKRLRGEEEG